MSHSNMYSPGHPDNKTQGGGSKGGVSKGGVSRPFTCSFCYLSFRTKSNVRHHMAMVHKISQNRCTICNMEFSSSVFLEKHILVHNKKNTESPEVVEVRTGTEARTDANKNTSGSSLQQLLGHKNAGVEGFCDRATETQTQNDVLQHMAATQSLQCGICDKIFSSVASLDEHLLQHENKKSDLQGFFEWKTHKETGKDVQQTAVSSQPIQFAVCNENFSIITSSDGHFMQYTDKKPRVDQVRQRETDTEMTKSETGDDVDCSVSEDIHCPVCVKQFSSSAHYKEHLLSHKYGKGSDKNPIVLDDVLPANGDEEGSSCSESYACGVCFRSFATKYTAHKHMASHNSYCQLQRSTDSASVSSSFQHLNRHDLPSMKANVSGQVGPDKKHFSCRKCRMSFDSKISLMQHLSTSPCMDTLASLRCDEGFTSKSARDNHLITSHPRKRPFKCSKCPRRFRNSQQLQDHTQKSCCVCHMSFYDQSSLDKHLVSHDTVWTGGGTVPEEPMSECPLCCQVFQQSDIERHMQTHHKDMTSLTTEDETTTKFNAVECTIPEHSWISYTPDIGPKKETENCSIRKPVTFIPEEEDGETGTEKSIRIAASPKDDFSGYVAGDNWYAHSQIDTESRQPAEGLSVVAGHDTAEQELGGSDDDIYDEEPVTLSFHEIFDQKRQDPCLVLPPVAGCRAPTSSDCEEMNASTTAAKEDITRCRTGEEIPGMENRAAGNEDLIKTNLSESSQKTTHTDDNQRDSSQSKTMESPSINGLYACMLCSHLCPTRADLSSHMGTHDGESPQFVGKVGPSLQFHRFLHEEKRFSCSLCDRRFHRKYNLKTHLATHSRERPFSCRVCKRTFPCKDNLTKHMVIHDKGRKHVCGYCQRVFKRRVGIKQHMRLFHPGEKFVCDICNKSYGQFTNLKKHRKMHASDSVSGGSSPGAGEGIAVEGVIKGGEKNIPCNSNTTLLFWQNMKNTFCDISESEHPVRN